MAAKFRSSYSLYIILIVLERRKRELRQWKEDTRAEAIAEGHAEGLAEGHATGRSDEKLEIARKMKIADRPLAEIEEFTGLSPEIVEQL